MKNRYINLNNTILLYISGFLILSTSCNQKSTHNMDNESNNKLLNAVDKTIKFINTHDKQTKKPNDDKNRANSKFPVDEIEEKRKDKKVSKLFPSIKVESHKYNLEGLKLEILYEDHGKDNPNQANYIIQKIYDPQYAIHLELPSHIELKEYEGKNIKSKILNKCLQGSILKNKEAQIIFFDPRHIFSLGDIYVNKRITISDKIRNVPELFLIGKSDLHDLKSKKLEITDSVLDAWNKQVFNSENYTQLQKTILSKIQEDYEMLKKASEENYLKFWNTQEYKQVENLSELFYNRKYKKETRDAVKQFLLNLRFAINKVADYCLMKNIFDLHRDKRDNSKLLHLVNIGMNHDIHTPIKHALNKYKK